MDEVLKGAAPAGGLDPTAVPIVITLVHGTWAAKLATTGTFYLAAAREKTGIDTGALVMYTNIQAQEKGDSLGRRLIVLSLLLGGCRESNKKSAVTSQDNIKSVYTSLEAGSCNQETDQNDPNAASYLLCPGVAGYELIVRQVDSGRTSIDVVDAIAARLPAQLPGIHHAPHV